MTAIETKGLTKYYGKSRGITDISLTVEEGDFFGFIGPNGAGKSTTIRSLLGLIIPSSGTAKILGSDISDKRRNIFSLVGYMPSEASFYGSMKAGEIIRYSAELRKQNCKKEADILCERLKLDRSKKVCELSLGNRKKVSIVCALQHFPKLCILDEPTSGLDPVIQREFFEILKERNNSGAAVFLSSHILSEIQKYCRHAAVLREGRILISDRMENLVHTNAKKVMLSGVSEAPDISGITNAETEVGTVKFLYSGETGALLNALSQMPVKDINITEPDLEEIIMHYYTEQDKEQKL